MGTVKMWNCKKHGLSVLEETADAFCARRYEESLDGKHDASFSSCANCERGIFLFEQGKHRTGAATGTEQKGEANMATITKKCRTHGEYETNRSNGVCPACKGVKKAAPAAPKKKEGADIALRTPHSALRTPHSALSVSVSLDLAQYPKLRERLIMIGLQTMLEELEAKA